MRVHFGKNAPAFTKLAVWHTYTFSPKTLMRNSGEVVFLVDQSKCMPEQM
jgi:hypothetical protein